MYLPQRSIIFHNRCHHKCHATIGVIINTTSLVILFTYLHIKQEQSACLAVMHVCVHSAHLTISLTRSSAYTGYECRKGLCSRSQCRLTGHCTVMPLSNYGLRQFTSVADIPSRQRLRSSTSDDLCVPAARLPTVGRRAFSVAGARVWNALPADVTYQPR